MAKPGAPEQQFPRLIVVMAFDRDEEGTLQTVFGPADHQSEDRAVRAAKDLARKHAGVIAWAREARPDVGEYGEPTVLYQHGDVPDME